MISVVILTKNEQQDLPDCLASVAWSNDVHVFDSHSTDQTTAIARSFGAKVSQRPFDNYAAQRNAALQGLHFANPWVLLLDADERMRDDLANEMRRTIQTVSCEVAGFRLRRRDYFMGRWLKHAQISPYFIRLVQAARAHYEREINEVMVVDGKVLDLNSPFDHYPFSKGIAHWIEKHNFYSSLEAGKVLEARSGASRFSPLKAFCGRDFNERRMHQKILFYHLPCRPLIKFIYMTAVRRAILDGRAGVTYAMLQAVYEYFIVLKTRELSAKSAGD
jgi:glycosyltransferase involved in cell wall biosynthesis